ncbi:MAG: hypothetical protein BJ554DRAFT_630, partial [Olpidium bornovanus]
RKLIPHIIPIARWFTFLCHQRWESHEVIRLIQKTPMLFLAGEMDNIVPPAHMKELFKLCPTQGKKVWKSFPRGEHNDTCLQPGYFEVHPVTPELSVTDHTGGAVLQHLPGLSVLRPAFIDYSSATEFSPRVCVFHRTLSFYGATSPV